MKLKIQHTSLLKFGLAVAMVLGSSVAVQVSAQNTKGDRAVGNQRQIRETKSKSVKKREKARTRDIAGRRLRTKDKSSASRANANHPQPNPYASRPRIKTDRAAKPVGRVFGKSPKVKERGWKGGDISGSPVRRIKPRSAEAARANVYPQYGPNVNNPSRKPRAEKRPKAYTRTATGQPVVHRVPQQRQRAWKGNIKGGAIGSPSATGRTKNEFHQRNQYSRYTGKVKKNNQRAVSNRTEVKRAARLSKTPGFRRGQSFPFSGSSSFVQRGRKNAYWGKYSKGERAITTDIAGRPLRARNFRSTPAGLVGRDTLKFFGRKPGGDRSFGGKVRRGKFTGSAREGKSWRGDVSGWRLRKLRPSKPTEVAGDMVYPRNLSISQSGKRGKPLPGGGFSSRSKPPGGTPGKPVMELSPGRGAKRIARAFNQFKGIRPLKGGGSVSGKRWNNNGMPIDPKLPPAGAQRAGKFQGNIRQGQRGFSDQGEGFSGTIKTSRRPLKGGGSVSGKLWNNNRTPIDPKLPPASSQRAGRFQGNLRQGQKTFADQGEGFSGTIKTSRRPLKGGGSVSGKLWNNNNTPIDPKLPPASSQRAGRFQGNLRQGQKTFADQGEGFSGYIKTKRPVKGGGSVSGKLWNNNNTPIDPKLPPASAQRAGKFQGNIRQGQKTFADQGEGFSGNIKTKRPAKGGGSVSGKLWNNNEEPIQVRVPLGSGKKMGLLGNQRVKQGYDQNPNAHKLSTMKQEPTRSTFQAQGLQVKIKRDDYRKKPYAADDAMKGIGPRRATVKASEYARGLKVMWNTKHNPHSAKEALDGRQPGRVWERGVEHAGNRKARYPYRHNPNSADDALKVIYLGKAYARIEDFQGNTKMRKYNARNLHPDAKFAHSHLDNVKDERTLLVNIKLMWSKLFKKSETQPDHLKKKEHRPRYDRREQGLWYD